MPNTTSTSSPLDELKQEIDSVKSDLRSVVEKVKLASVRDDFSELDTNIANLPIRLQKLRYRKYAFNKILETQFTEYKKQWESKKYSIQNQINTESSMMQNALRPLESRVNVLNPSFTTLQQVKSLESEIDSFESRVSATERSINEMFDDLESEVSKVKSLLTLVEFSLDQFETASFGFLPGESLVMAVKGTWTRDDKEDKTDPEGILFLTDQRLLFEQKQEIATKKVLFITTEREKVQQLLFEVPVASVTSVKAEKQGMFKNEDWLTLEFASGSFARSAKLHIDGQDCNTWQQLITQVKTREIDTDRAFAIDQAAVEKAQSAPVKCPNCGGSITKPVLRGMDSITCDFCGNRIKL